jgi:LuxR family maltose regulon positive regulatory protein
LENAERFSYKNHAGGFVAQKENRRNGTYWYAYRRSGRLLKTYLGKSEELTADRLELAGQKLTGQTLLNQYTNQPAGQLISPFEPSITSTYYQSTKVNVPVVPRQLVTRPRLTRRILTPLTLIYAPSGFGKSTLLNDWKQTCGFPVAWLTLDTSNNHIKQFWYSVIMAMNTIGHEFGKSLYEYLHATQHVTAADLIARFIYDISIFQKECPLFGLVMDDFHRINQSEIYSSVQLLFEKMPANFQLVIAGHSKPPFSLGSLRAQGMLTELDANDLRFTPDEGMSYLLQYMPSSSLSSDDLSKLVKRTEGWAAGLTLAALAFSKQEHPRRFVDSFTGAHIYMREYFLETVLQRSTPDMQDFLLKTAILKNLTGKLCDAVTLQSNGEEMLKRLWDENLFIVRLEEEGWYRYHDLFAEMLLSQLKTNSPDEIPELHKRAAQWYRDQLDPAEAIYHLIATESWEEAALLIEETALRELEQFGEDSRLLRWLQELPENIVQKHKTLLFLFLRLAFNALSTNAISAYLSRIESTLSNKPVSQLSIDEVSVLDEIHKIRRTWSKGIPYIPPMQDESPNESKWELLNGIQLMRQGFGPVNREWAQQVYSLIQNAQRQKNLFVLLMVGGGMARRIFNEGQFRRSEKMARMVLEQALAQLGRLPETSSIALTTISNIYLEQDDQVTAHKYLEQAIEIDPNPTSSNMLVQCAIQRMEVQLAQKNYAEAIEIIHDIQELHLHRPSGGWSDQDLMAYEALIYVRKGDLTTANQIMLSMQNFNLSRISRIIQAEVYIAKNQPEAALRVMENLLEESKQGLLTVPIMRVRIMLAEAYFMQHNINQSLHIMKEALRLAEPEHYIRPFLDGDEICQQLLALVLETGNITESVQKFIRLILQKTNYNGSEHKISPLEIEEFSRSASISRREQDILRLISAGYSNSQIASSLCLSVSTVKTHVGNIFVKLGVKNRAQAIVSARELHLV